MSSNDQTVAEAAAESEYRRPDGFEDEIQAIAESEPAAVRAEELEAASDATGSAPIGAPDEDWPLCPVCAGNGRVPPELAAARTKGTCPECNGLGNVRTGSLVADYAVQQCDRCMGNGYIDVPRQVEDGQEPSEPWQTRY